LLANDLGALAASGADRDEARKRFLAALKIDPGCEPARTNLAFLDADRTPVKVAILSFLFNWPSTGGGIVHTVELARFLEKAGFDVRHVYARYAAWGIGGVAGEPPLASDVLKFDEASWNVAAIQARFRTAVDAFRPDYI